MAEHKNKFYKYDEALKLKHPNEDSIAKTHNARPTSMNFVFDSVDDAGEFAKEVIQKKSGDNVFKAEKSFTNPRSGENLPKDYSESCIIL
ncbi:hypothetical protein LRAMOSA03757 [Lichtheimia ramosa]|uniref:Uncharacterized protein n=1 Tax=Lichtheimia ramosa TaxID=688394 RepID=A0A077WWD1_9FUNG|nr:hypothetical protein LRAMOSA03757 [Lichtheimia ramosa]